MKPNLVTRIFNLYTQSPRVALLMSGKGSNVGEILANAHRYSNLNFVTICTDQTKSNAYYLSQYYGLNYFCLEGSVRSAEEREAYFQQLANYLHALKIDTLIYAGFMKISPSFFIDEFPGINVHPADLTIKQENGKPRYVGMHAIRDAIQGGEIYLASTAHVVDTETDCGVPIMVSKRLRLEGKPIQDIASLHEELKTTCEHSLYPVVLELMSKNQLSIENIPYHWHDGESN
jgi:phosphoribosylglycinamide formyltransferase-1